MRAYVAGSRTVSYETAELRHRFCHEVTPFDQTEASVVEEVHLIMKKAQFVQKRGDFVRVLVGIEDDRILFQVVEVKNGSDGENIVVAGLKLKRNETFKIDLIFLSVNLSFILLITHHVSLNPMRKVVFANLNAA